MTRLRLYLWSMIVRKRARICSKVEIIIWRTDDFAQALSKRLTNITIIAFETQQQSQSHRCRIAFVYNIYN